MRRSLIALAALALPLATLFAMVAHAEWDWRHGTVITVGITGFDPRDMLRGHFMRYRIAWNWVDRLPGGIEDAVCVLSGGKNPQVRPLLAGETCKLTLRAGTDMVAFMPAGITDELFIPENQAETVSADPSRVTVDLTILPNGTARLLGWKLEPEPVK